MLPRPLTPNTFVTVGTASLPSLPSLLSPLLGLIYHLPLWGWLYPPTQNQPHSALEMPPLWKMLCKWPRAAYSNYACEYDFYTLVPSFMLLVKVLHDCLSSQSPQHSLTPPPPPTRPPARFLLKWPFVPAPSSSFILSSKLMFPNH